MDSFALSPKCFSVTTSIEPLHVEKWVKAVCDDKFFYTPGFYERFNGDSSIELYPRAPEEATELRQLILDFGQRKEHARRLNMSALGRKSRIRAYKQDVRGVIAARLEQSHL